MIANILIVLGFCTATVGAAGFGPTTETLAVPLLIGGVLVLGAGGVMQKKAKAAAVSIAGAEHGGLRGELKRLLHAIKDRVTELDEQKSTLSPDDMRVRIDGLLTGEYFDLTSQNEEIAREIGYNDYARIWEGVAVAERQLARVWSMTTDGYMEQSLVDLTSARKQIEHACAMADQTKDA